ncbi:MULTISPECIES: DUF4129 domain-containing protein [Halomicrobium]|uniref:Protein-glutamine gamma-glutamyltransferase-like C-terminal domain-containing protein n=2 Tax=Halomicrobium mukohataei TaxID=57705 RepID=C7NVS2_HALMD|nr:MULTISPECIES: DUF4129 domain-containing protein [Halomicrobium]ACV46187.1 hypothetical protein Hmuk_0036 [Halomicrobium mukohataei DSM 12286]QCD64755.1 DUF4129 domain-containing protein [Halomicrobium mukohataei]QFR19562.1 DUF4129 domain-containing protein [Halomicrobium sp. ZPS1]
MTIDRIGPALVVVLGVLAISAAAAGLDSPETATAVGTGESEGAGAGSSDGTGYTAEQMADTAAPNASSPFGNWVGPALQLLLVGGTAAYLAWVGYRLWREGASAVPELLKHAVTTVVPAGVAWLVLFGSQLFTLSWGEPDTERSTSGSPEHLEGGGSASAVATDAVSDALPLVALVIGAVVLVAGLVVLASRLTPDGDASTGTVADAPGPSREPDTVADSRASGRFEDADAEATNAVYRAWRELASEVEDADRRTQTPAEIAARARVAGFDRDAVATLTDRFREVRYGQRPPTSERETSARSALDRLRSEGDR